ncbi:MAG TPA: hypothetical protein VMK42_14255 [Anaeromyxobacteraceae bacterium]|nr:hypothetical protein [Anaeromyxobacteraceae bacterium]
MPKRRAVAGFLVAAVIGGLAMLVMACSWVRSVALLAPPWAGFAEVAPDIWVERGADASTREKALLAAREARARIERFYARPEGHPILLACGTFNCFRWHGGIGHGTTYFGNRVLLSPLAVNPVKAAHEFSHVELSARVGALRALLRVPSWFDEGLAVLVSEDPVFAEDRWLVETSGGATAPALDQLASMADWLAATRAHLPAYGTARHEVAAWYTRAGPWGLARLFAKLRAGEEFRRAYGEFASR